MLQYGRKPRELLQVPSYKELVLLLKLALGTANWLGFSFSNVEWIQYLRKSREEHIYFWWWYFLTKDNLELNVFFKLTFGIHSYFSNFLGNSCTGTCVSGEIFIWLPGTTSGNESILARMLLIFQRLRGLFIDTSVLWLMWAHRL